MLVDNMMIPTEPTQVENEVNRDYNLLSLVVERDIVSIKRSKVWSTQTWCAGRHN